ncbi:hypothetical protein [Amaricoccus macauensis]|uniref:hypothetical protein n=1 Tax=Amaricoccus macauensis TaxID=57001 RepID=UPI003C7B56EC
MTALFDAWMAVFRAPLSGNVTQDIDPRFFSPTVNVDIAGDGRLEGRIVRNVASYGRQLDTVIDTVLRLAEKTGTDAGELAGLSARIEAEKLDHRATLRERAEDALTDLLRDDPEAYRELVRGLR